MITDIIVDLETLAKNSTESVVLSIGAYAFNRKDINDTENYSLHLIFGKKEFIRDQVSKGRVYEEGTIEFWKEQNSEARKIFKPEYNNVGSIKEALYKFSNFYDRFSERVSMINVWGNDMLFDIGILKSLYQSYDMVPPWEWYEPRCYRTLIQEHKLVADKPDFSGTPHCAIDDAKYQALRLQLLFEKFRKCGIANER